MTAAAVDILTAVAEREPRPFLIGFAAEVEDLERNARSKLLRKNLDMIVGNLIEDGIGTEIDRVEVYWQGGTKRLAPATKIALGEKLIRFILEFRQTRRPANNNEEYDEKYDGD